jgi:hypothetical protein
VICDKTRVRILELGDKVLEEGEFQRQRVSQKIEELITKEDK